MTITVELPDDLMAHQNAGREALEAFVLASYEADALTSLTARRMLGMQRMEFLAFIAERGVKDRTYGMQQLLEDIETGDRLRAAGLLPR